MCERKHTCVGDKDGEEWWEDMGVRDCMGGMEGQEWAELRVGRGGSRDRRQRWE